MHFYRIVPVLLCLNLAWVAWQDFKSREISVISLIVLTVLLVTNSLLKQQVIFLAYNAMFSVVFLAIQALFAGVFFWFRNSVRSEKVRFSDLIGGADIWMMLGLILSFNWVLYILFTTASTIIALIVYLLLKVSGRLKDERIPLAGVFAVLYMAVLICSRLFPGFEPHSFAMPD
jgi:hypothetical protein